MNFTLLRNISYIIIIIASIVAAIRFYKVPNGPIRKLLIYDKFSMAVFFIFAIIRVVLDAYDMEVLGNLLCIPAGINLAVSSVLLLVLVNRK